MKGFIFFGDSFHLFDQDLIFYECFPHEVVVVDSVYEWGLFEGLYFFVGVFLCWVGFEFVNIDGRFFLFVEQVGNLVSDVDFFVNLLLDFCQS